MASTTSGRGAADRVSSRIASAKPDPRTPDAPATRIGPSSRRAEDRRGLDTAREARIDRPVKSRSISAAVVPSIQPSIIDASSTRLAAVSALIR
ncbi:hypothetical protein V2J94_48435, partial [Streptomyces sp. DSM 41524]|nr:hypothetical protein [Streptomyces sp. DSM 41524]